MSLRGFLNWILLVGFRGQLEWSGHKFLKVLDYTGKGHCIIINAVATFKDDRASQGVRLNTAYNFNGDYVGGSWSHVVANDIKPELIPGRNVCSIGYSEKHNSWFGWSHRAISSFAVGDFFFRDEDDPAAKNKLVVITNLDEAKEQAILFAKSVS